MNLPSDQPDRIQKPEDLEFVPFTIPGFSGDTQAAFPNNDLSVAPFIALLIMAPGAFLKKHYHQTADEAVYVVEGELINDGQPLPAGSFLTHGSGVWHGPHTTRTGCKLMFIQSVPVGPEDSVFVD